MITAQTDLFEHIRPIRQPEATFRAKDMASRFSTVSQDESDSHLEKWIKYSESQCKGRNSDITILSLFDESGVWSAPYVRAGYNVIQMDIQNGVDINELTPEVLMNDWGIGYIDGILAACPCTHFANSGARWFKKKDDDGITQEGINLVHKTMGIIEFFEPIFWCIENPIGRIQELCGLPDPRLRFHPHNYGDPYTKYTQLFGEFDHELPICNVEPTEGSRVHNLSGTNPKHKKLRSLTPEGFAYAFFMANQLHLLSDKQLEQARHQYCEEY